MNQVETIETIDIDAMWRKYTEEKDVEIRNQIVLYYIKIVKNIVYRIVPSYCQYVSIDDMMSCGVMGLIGAVSRFDITKQVNFTTFAYQRIKGEIIDFLRKQDFVSNGLRHKIKTVENAFSVLESKEGRPASEQEVCEYLNIDNTELRKTLENSYTYNVVYLDEILENSNQEPEEKNINDLPETYCEHQDTQKFLADKIKSLPEKERMVITLYYYEEMNLKEIGAVLNVSESRVSQIHSKALFHLRGDLNNFM